MFTNLKQLTEVVSGKFIIALTDKTGRIIGYYVADDEELIDNPKKALVFNAVDQAEKNAKLSNTQWDLDRGQKFIVVDQQTAKVITEEKLVESVAKFKKGDRVRLKKSMIAKLKNGYPNIKFNTNDTAVISGAGVGGKNPGERWKFRVSFDKPFFGDKSWPETFLELATINEGIEYPDSSYFDADVDKVMDLLKKALNIVDKAEWADWMEQTDTNFGTSHGSAEDLNEKLYTAVEEAQNAIKTLYDHMIYVSEN